MDTSRHNSIMSLFLMLSILVIEAMGQKESDEVSESLISNMDFKVRENIQLDLILILQSIMVGVVGFWGGVFCMGSVYLLMVLAKRVFHPEEAEKTQA